MNSFELKKSIASIILSITMSGSTGLAITRTAHAAEMKNQKIVQTVDAKTNINSSNESHKVAVFTTKVDEFGVTLSGAHLQIIDFDGNVLDEWISDNTKHISLLPEGHYILHEEKAPNGYKLSNDKLFSVKTRIKDVNGGVVHDDSEDVCWHYGGVPLYYVESKGKKDEVYCINQGLSEPDDINYNGTILNEKNIKSFVPDADPNMSNNELYDKILDIIYHRSLVNEKFPTLSETEIRYITEYALKNYTSTMVDDGMLFRRYRYDSTANTKFVEDLENGSAIGQLAKHWWYYHNKQTIPDIYVELYNYLIDDKQPHPEDMFLYIYSTKIKTEDGEKYQNLLGVKWFDPYDEEYVVNLTKINELDKSYTPPKTGDDANLLLWSLSALGSASLGLFIATRKKDKTKIKK